MEFAAMGVTIASAALAAGQKWLPVLTLLVLILGAARVAATSLTNLSRRVKPPFPRGQIFPGIVEDTGDISGDQYIERKVELQKLRDWLAATRTPGTVLAITGDSGVGKSTLVRMLESVADADSGGSPTIARWSLGGGTSTPTEALKEALALAQAPPQATPRGLLIVLDQFEVCIDELIESYFAPSSSNRSLRSFLVDDHNENDDLLYSSLRELVHYQAGTNHVRVACVVRADRYYDLRLFANFGQAPFDAFEVLGFGDGSARQTLLTKLSQLGISGQDRLRIINDLAGYDGTVLPSRAQLVGCALEEYVMTPEQSRLSLFAFGPSPRRSAPEGQLTFEAYSRFGGADGLIERFFRQALASCPDPQIARELLFVMSLEGRVRKHFTPEELATVTYRGSSDLQPTLRYLADTGLCRRVSGRRFAFRHDFLAAAYSRLSGRLLQPVVRDNIAYSHAAVLGEPHKEYRTSTEQRTYVASLGRALRVVSTGLVLVFAFRLIAYHAALSAVASILGVNPTLTDQTLTIGDYSVRTTWYIDWNYLPIVLSQSTWAFYVVGVVSNVFARIDNKGAMRLQSHLLVLMVVVGMVATALEPRLWMICIGLIAAGVGVKFSLVGRQVASRVTGRNRFSLVGFYTLVNSFFVSYVGILVFLNLPWDLANYETAQTGKLLWSFLTLNAAPDISKVWYATLISLVYFIYMYKAHVRPDQAVEFVGLYKRID